MFRKLLSTTAVAGVALATVSSASASIDQAPVPATRYSATKPAAHPLAAPASRADHPELLQEAVTARRETQNAILAIDSNKPGDAIAALERATGKLEIVLARNPALALAPVDVATTSYDVLGSLQDVESVRESR